ncbi:hypothetical protein [Jannaschia pohangensis]|uniref:Uncharacterized protein n=1 Tax=Jannaschia pohangensis TaxID=390807 RepID=A0A1I3Q7B4_9RHOB|nr:hypothetical protein [Jannaschia pohangensis]SFJ29565.1 hypothetical protein SAMN04488095_2436 [Jannaschia pohangensis]
MTDGPPDKPRRKTDPVAKKARDKGRQRKIVSNSSDKSSRRNAPRVKALANRKLRRVLDVVLRDDPVAASEAAARKALRTRDRHWGSHNAADIRARRDEERAWLDANPPGDAWPGRSRWGWELLRRRTGLTQAEMKARIAARLAGKPGT